MHSALIVVDLQRDFLPGGELEILSGLEVIRPLLALARETDYVYATRDWHPEEHCSFSAEPHYRDGSWPAHCVQDSEGAMLDFEIQTIVNEVFSKGMDKSKEAYSGFDGSDLANGLSLEHVLRSNAVNRVVVGGLALDYCVKETALDAKRLGFDTVVAIDATRPVDYISGALAVAELAKHGVEIQNTGFWG